MNPELEARYASNILGTYEGAGQGITWKNAHIAKYMSGGPGGPLVDSQITFLTTVIMLWVDSIVYLLLAWYLDKVIPGTYGVARPWHFVFDSKYWSGLEHQNASLQSENGGIAAAPSDGTRDVESVDPDLVGQQGLSIRHLRREFDTATGLKVAVEDLNLDMYRGQITALLGHNGAGKSTTFNMLTGMLPPTAGDAVVDGYSIKDDLETGRSIIGVCPQHDVLWDELSVREHLELFAALKGLPDDEIEVEVTRMIGEVGLTEKANNFSSTLSGGMKRKLSVAIALIGGL